jgi:hypothetical protein
VPQSHRAKCWQSEEKRCQPTGSADVNKSIGVLLGLVFRLQSSDKRVPTATAKWQSPTTHRRPPCRVAGRLACHTALAHCVGHTRQRAAPSCRRRKPLRQGLVPSGRAWCALGRSQSSRYRTAHGAQISAFWDAGLEPVDVAMSDLVCAPSTAHSAAQAARTRSPVRIRVSDRRAVGARRSVAPWAARRSLAASTHAPRAESCQRVPAHF